jgi:Flp pilus assembly protein TadD
VLGLLTKTVTATLPAALLLILWWQRGRLRWRADCVPLLPFFALGAAAGGLSAWIERTLIGAHGAAFELTVVERFLLAGRVVWFYLGKLVWPAKLVFIYPRWQISEAAWRQYVFPVAGLLLLAALWGLRRRWRGPVAGVLFFVGTLLPVLGFCNVFPFLYSYVADHFQYLASLGIITLAAAGMAVVGRAGRREKGDQSGGEGKRGRRGDFAARRCLVISPSPPLPRFCSLAHALYLPCCLALLATLGVLTWRQSRMYADRETLYQATIERNPKCSMAHNNLAAILEGRGEFRRAIEHYQRALESDPVNAEAHNSLGTLLERCGRNDEAISHYQRALAIKPRSAVFHCNLAMALTERGQTDAAIGHFQQALAVKPDLALAHFQLGAIWAGRGLMDEATGEFQTTLELRPDMPEAHYRLGAILARRGQLDEAAAHYRQALDLARQQRKAALAGMLEARLLRLNAAETR